MVPAVDVPVREPAVPLDARGLTKRFGSFAAVDSLDVTLEPGTITGFLGPNGAGKSTTLRMLVGLITPDAGSVTIFGRPSRDPAARRSLGYLPADTAFIPHLSSKANLDVLAALHGSTGYSDRQLVADTLGFSTPEMRQPVSALSGGTRQKLSIIAALQHHPSLLLLDEPANRLDPLVHRRFCDLLQRIAREGRTVLLSSHVLGEVEDVCDRVVLIKAARVIRIADVDTLRTQAQRRVTVRYSGLHPAPEQLHDSIVTGHVVVGRMPAGRPDLVRQLLADPAVRDIEIEPPSLEDVFLGMYDEEVPDAGAHHR
jgi:ABC-2 type transport system ATP-binding protein